MLIFDSGVGGLCILQEIKKILPNIQYIYVLDNQAFPYGNKKELFIIERSIKIISQIKKNYPINVVVIACNTVSTIALSILRKKFSFPIIGIFPSIKFAETKTKNNVIGLVATKATIQSCYTKNIVNNKSFYNTIEIIGTNELAVIAEKKIRGIKITETQLKNIFKPWINLVTKPDTIILGCTHFLFLKTEIKHILNTPSIYFINSQDTMISQIQNYFNKFQIKQKIQSNIFLYSQYQKELKNLLLFITRYKFKKIQHINLN